MPPEYYNNQAVGRPGDIWALACILNQLITGKITFPGEKRKDLEPLVLNNIPVFLPAIYRQELRYFIRCMMRKNSEERPTAEELLKEKLFEGELNQTKIELSVEHQGESGSVKTMTVTTKDFTDSFQTYSEGTPVEEEKAEETEPTISNEPDPETA